MDEVEEAAEVQAEEIAKAQAIDPSLPADFNKPYFSRLIMDCSTDPEAHQSEVDALVAANAAKWGSQPTYEKFVKDEKTWWWERTQTYVEAIKDHGKGLREIAAKYELIIKGSHHASN